MSRYGSHIAGPDGPLVDGIPSGVGSRVVLVNGFNPYLCDGVSRSGYDLLCLLRREGFEVGIVTAVIEEHPYRRQMFEYFGGSEKTSSAVRGKDRCEAIFDGIPVIAEILSPATPKPAVVQALMRLLGEIGARTVLTSEDDVLALVAASMCGLGGCHFFHSLAYVKRIARNGLALRLLRDRRLVCCSGFLKRRVLDLLGLESCVCYPVMNVEDYRFVRSGGRIPTTIGFYSGGPHKGDEIVVRLAERLTHLRFVVVGRSFFSRELVPPNMVLLGDVPDVSEFYGQISVLVVPSLCEEAFSRVAVEACVNGIPVIANRVGGVPEAVGTGGILIGSGCVLTLEDGLVEDYVQAIERITGDSAALKAHVEAALAWASAFGVRQRSQSQSLVSGLFRSRSR